jgi:hypothetical protein
MFVDTRPPLVISFNGTVLSDAVPSPEVSGTFWLLMLGGLGLAIPRRSPNHTLKASHPRA